MFKRLAAAGILAIGAATTVLAADFRVPAEGAAAGSLPDAPRPVDWANLDLVKIVNTDVAAFEALKDEDYSAAALAATFGGDPMKAYDWVKANTQYQPYAGVLRGANRTLAARAGSSADRALLLAGLLNKMEVRTRFASTQLDDAAADALVQSSFALASISMAAPRGHTLDAIAERAGRDFALLRTALAAEANAATDDSLTVAREAVRAHVWVEAEIGGVWTALDPSANTAGETLAAAAGTSDTLPDALYQTVTLKLSATVISDGAVTNSEPFAITLKAAEVSAQSIFLGFVEDPKNAGIGGAINNAMGVEKRYVPVLWVEGAPHVGEVIPGLAPASKGGALDLLGEPEPEGSKPELARLELTIESAGPTGETGKAVRTLLDRAPATTTIEADTVLAPMPMVQDLPAPASMIHNVWISTGPLDLKNAYGVRALALTEIILTYSDPEKVKGLSPPELLWPLAAFNAALPMALENSALPGMMGNADVKVFTGRPRVSIFTRGALDGPGGRDYRVVEIDLKLGGATVLARNGAAKAAFETRLWIGTVEAALETEFGLRGGASQLEPGTATEAGASTASNTPLKRLGVSGEALAAAAPRNATAAAASHALFAPDGALVAWWDVDPATGETTAMLAPDLGGFRSYGGYRPPPSNYLNSSYTNARTGLQSNPFKYRPPGGGGPPPNSCSGGNEYMTIVGCVSLPSGWALSYFYALAVVDVVVLATDVIVGIAYSP